MLGRACRRIAQTWSAFKHAEIGIHERSARLLSNCWQMDQQLEIFLQIQRHLDGRGQLVQINVLDILVSKLEYADAKLNGLVQSWSPDIDTHILHGNGISKRDRANCTIQKDSLDKAIEDIESWQRVAFNPLWFAIMKIQSQLFDKQLDYSKEKDGSPGSNLISEAIAVRNPPRKAGLSHVYLPSGKLKAAEITEIAFSPIRLVHVDGKWRLLDSVSDLSKDAVGELATKLKCANPTTFGLLTCLGVVHNENNNEFSLIFRMPDNASTPETLRASIMANDITHSLSDRFRLATQLARAVVSIHTFGMAHKSIRPENIILFRDQESTLGSAFLLGFERVRGQADGTRLKVDPDWEKNVYRHPQRQGPRIRDRYVMQHDIYSLGVILLEIGLWSSFVEYGNGSQLPTRPQTYNLRVEGSNDSNRPELVKSRLLYLTTNKLPQEMGTKYAGIVESCLTCLDLGNEDFGDGSEFQDDGATVAVRYIDRVCTDDDNS
jgi:hypothetical protein